MKHIKEFNEFINEKWSDHRDEWDADSRTTYDKAAEKFARRAIAMRIDGTNVTNASKLDTLKSAAVSFAPKGMTAKEFFIAAAPNAGLIPKDPSWDALARTNRDKWNEVRADVATDLWDGKLTESLNESEEYEYKDDSGNGKPTKVLKLSPASWQIVKHLFDDNGRPKSDDIKRIPSENSVWDLYAQSYESGGKIFHKIYGVSGDYTFGNAPTFYQQKLRGNKKAAVRVFDYFINKYLK